jgi:predicted AlkP superfamily pyrophosphatase or phosphodiesterase
MNSSTAIDRVVLVVLDGLRPDAVDAFDLVHVADLAARGAATFTARTVTPSVTAAAMASLFTGLAPSRHGVVSDRFHVPRQRGRIDPLPRVLAGAGFQSSAFIGSLPRLYAGLARQIARHVGIDRAVCSGETARAIVASARPTLAQQRRGLIVLHWPDADRAGHEHGWMSRAYAAGARAMDQALGELVSALAHDDDGGGTLLIALADHGGGGAIINDHDSTHPADQTIPIILAGATVDAGQLTGSVSLLDVPPTVLWALGVACPATYEGRALVEGFAPAAAPAVAPGVLPVVAAA